MWVFTWQGLHMIFNTFIKKKCKGWNCDDIKGLVPIFFLTICIQEYFTYMKFEKLL